MTSLARAFLPLAVRRLQPQETDTAAAVLGRGMRDNPLHIQAFGSDPERRERVLIRMFEAVLRQHVKKGSILGAFSAEEMIGVCSMVSPGRCKPTAGEKLSVVPGLVGGAGLGSTVRVLDWVGRWARQDPAEPHWHLGPVGVERHLQGQGAGSAMLRSFCALVDSTKTMSYLETDTKENVAFYERFGFGVVAEEPVLGIPNWYMVRPGG